MILDTGAAFTCIHSATAVELFGMSAASLDPSSWPASRSIVGIGGALQYLEFAAEFGFGGEDGTLEVLTGALHIGELASRGTPPILGWDLLRQFQLSIDGPAGTVELRRP